MIVLTVWFRERVEFAIETPTVARRHAMLGRRSRAYADYGDGENRARTRSSNANASPMSYRDCRRRRHRLNEREDDVRNFTNGDDDTSAPPDREVGTAEDVTLDIFGRVDTAVG